MVTCCDRASPWQGLVHWGDDGLGTAGLEHRSLVLPAGNFEMDAYQDGANADKLGSDYKKVMSTVTNKSKVTIKMARGGGWAARIVSARG